MTKEVLKQKSSDAKERVLRRSGAIVRGIMRRMIKYQPDNKIKSPPGRPPYSHVQRGGIRNLIFWEYDHFTGTVVIGPKKDSSISNVRPVPGALDKGGKTLVRVENKRNSKRVLAHIRPRPFTDEALARFQNQYPDLWKDCIK
jgi:hypothetical protein